jgi:hypothetical protein
VVGVLDLPHFRYGHATRWCALGGVDHGVDNRASCQKRGLKHRAATEIRTIPIPPGWSGGSAHIKRYGTTPDGRIFQTAWSGIIQDAAY